MKPTDSPHLNRSLGRLDMVALGINGVVGSGIFFLPSRGDELMGPAALFATAGAGLLCLLIALCFAEVASHFDQTGGPYLYAREAFGNFVFSNNICLTVQYFPKFRLIKAEYN